MNETTRPQPTLASSFTHTQRHAFLESFDTILLDCDGVIWHGDQIIPGVKKVLERLRALGKRLLFVSNNSTKSRDSYLVKFKALGIEGVDKDDVFGSAYASALYVARNLAFPADKRVYVVGMDGIRDELELLGVQVADEDGANLNNISQMHTIQHDPSIGAVLFGFDLDFNYKKLAKAYTYIHSGSKVHFLATNADRTFPAANGTVYPGTGALLASLSHALGREPTVIGKPHQPMLDAIVEKGHLNRARTIMVGDRLDTDIAFGKHGGLQTLLVLTGVTKPLDVEVALAKSDPTLADSIPDYVIDSLGNLFG